MTAEVCFPFLYDHTQSLSDNHTVVQWVYSGCGCYFYIVVFQVSLMGEFIIRYVKHMTNCVISRYPKYIRLYSIQSLPTTI